MRVYTRDVIVVSVSLLCWASSASAQEGEAPEERSDPSIPERVAPRAEESVQTPPKNAREPKARAPSQSGPIKDRSAPVVDDGSFQLMSPKSIALQVGASSGGCFLGAGAGAGAGILGAAIFLEVTQVGDGGFGDLAFLLGLGVVGYGVGCIAGATGGAYLIGRERKRGGGLLASALGSAIGGSIGALGFALGPVGIASMPLGAGLGASAGYGLSRRVRHKLNQKLIPSASIVPLPGGGHVGLTLRF